MKNSRKIMDFFYTISCSKCQLYVGWDLGQLSKQNAKLNLVKTKYLRRSFAEFLKAADTQTHV